MSSRAAARPTFGIRAGAEALRALGANLHFERRGVVQQRLLVGVGDDELDVAESGRDHAVDGVAASPADADDFDPGARLRELLVQRDAELLGLRGDRDSEWWV